VATLYQVLGHALYRKRVVKARALLLFVFLTGILVYVSAGKTKADDVWVLAAASLTDAVTEVIDSYQKVVDERILTSFAGSSSLARQIENGAPADIFISANLAWMDVLTKDTLIEAETRKDALGNRLVLITPITTEITLSIKPNFDIALALGDSRLAIADPDFVPAGQYAVAALKQLGVWPQVASKLAPGSDVRNTLLLVERAETKLGIVYETDVPASNYVKIVDYFPTESYPPIIYSFGIINGSHRPAVESFYSYLTGETAMKIFETYGFTTR